MFDALITSKFTLAFNLDQAGKDLLVEPDENLIHDVVLNAALI